MQSVAEVMMMMSLVLPEVDYKPKFKKKNVLIHHLYYRFWELFPISTLFDSLRSNQWR